MDKNTDNDTKNFEECDGLDILASYERLYPPDNFETLQDIPTPYRSGDNAQNDKKFTKWHSIRMLIQCNFASYFLISKI